MSQSVFYYFFFFSSRRRHTRSKRDWSSDVCSSDLPINPGNSGGPLMNVLGELVGVNVAIRAGAQNIGFALPIDFVVGRAAELIGPRKRAGLRHGLVARDNASRASAERPLVRTVTVEAVEAGSPAADAGFQAGDVGEQ